MAVKAYELAGLLQKSGAGPLYVLMGEEDCLREHALALIQQTVVGGGGDDANGLAAFNEDLLYGDEHTAGDIVLRAQEAPVFAARRLVVVKNAEKLPAREGETLLPYLKNPSETTTVVFSAHKLDGRLKFTQALLKAATVVECGPLPEARLTTWITEEGKRCGVRLDEDATQLVKEIAEASSMTMVQRELEKLAAYVPPGRIAGSADVEALRGMSPGASVFDLASAIGARDRGRILHILARNLEVGEAPLRILGSLAWQYRQIWKAKDALQTGGTESEAARLLRLPPFKVRAFLGQFSESHLGNAFRKFLETDGKLKGGSASAGGRVLERMLLELCLEAVDLLAPQRPPVRPAAQAGEKRSISNVRTIRSGRPSTR